MFDPNDETIQDFIKSVNEKISELSEGNISEAINENSLTLDLALVYDSVMLYTSALNLMALEEGANMTCDAEESWSFGSSIVNYVRTVSNINIHVLLLMLSSIININVSLSFNTL